MRTFDNYNLLNNNTFGISAKCHRFVEIETAEEAERYLPFIAKTTKPLMIIGGGSNLLLTKDYNGIIVRSAIKGITISPKDSSILLTAGSGETFDDVVSAAISLGYYGMENLSIIPGDVGASAVQNIGAYGAEAADIIEQIEAVEISTGKKVTIPSTECHYAYRQSRFKAEWKGRYFITSVTYRLQTDFMPRLEYGGIRNALAAKGIAEPTAAEVRETIIEIRNAKLPDPKVLGNGGSFFMNPIVSQEKFEALQKEYPNMPYYIINNEPSAYDVAKESTTSGTSTSSPSYKIPAGWMIEQCGWKGKALGRAAVHDKQALVLVNLGNATGDEVLALCNAVRDDVFNKFGIDIHPEVNII